MEKKKRESDKANQKQRAKASSLYSTGKTTHRRHSARSGEGESSVGPGAQGHHLLSPQEQALCSGIRLPPVEYLIVKAALQAASLEQEGMTKEECCEAIRLEPHKVTPPDPRDPRILC